MACTTERDADGAVLSITCTRGPSAPLTAEAAALLAHFEAVGLVAEAAPRPAAPAVDAPALFDL